MSLLPSGPLARVFEASAIQPAAQFPAGTLPMGVYSAAPTALTERQASWFRLNTSRELMVSATIVPPAPSSLSALRASVTAGAAATTAIVAASPGNRIYVLQLYLVMSAACTAQILSNATGLTGVMTISANAVLAWDAPGGIYPVFATAVGEALNLTLAGAGAAAGNVLYLVAP